MCRKYVYDNNTTRAKIFLKYLIQHQAIVLQIGVNRRG